MNGRMLNQRQEEQMNEYCKNLLPIYRKNPKAFKRVVYRIAKEVYISRIDECVDFSVTDMVEQLMCSMEMYVEEHPEERNGEVAYKSYMYHVDEDPFKTLRLPSEVKHRTLDSHFLPKKLAGLVIRSDS